MEELLSLLNPDQREYNNLADRILEKNDLLQAEELRFYELHFKVSVKKYHAASELVRSYRERKSGNDRMVLSEQERKFMFQVLEEKRLRKGGLNRWEYNYLCFVKHLYEMETEAQCPKIPTPKPITFKDFIAHFATNSHRKKLVRTLLKGLLRCATDYNLESVDFLVGGSFLTGKEIPGDIDLALILPINAFRSDYKQEKMNTIILEFRERDEDGQLKKRLDINKLPDNFSSEIYMGYEVLTLFGNKAQNMDEDGLSNNQFETRNVYRINSNVEELNILLNNKGLQEPFISE